MLSAKKFWIAMCNDVIHHEVVGPKVKTPRASDPSITVWQPFAVWFWMLTETAHKPRTRVLKGYPIKLDRGQVAVSERYIAQMANWSRKSVRAFLERLQRFDMIAAAHVSRDGQMLLDFSGTKKGPSKGPTITIVTICNYDRYQTPSKPKGTIKGTSKGPARDQNLTSDNSTYNNLSSHQSPISNNPKQYQSSGAGIDGTDGSNVVHLAERRGMVMDAPDNAFVLTAKTRERIEALGCDPEELIDRMHEQIDKGRRIGSKSRYLITSALNEAHERDGTPMDVLKALISGNKFARANAIIAASFGKTEATDAQNAMRARTTAPRTNGGALLAGLKR